MAFSLKRLIGSLIGVAGKFAPLIEALLGTLGPKLSSKQLNDFLEACDELDEVFDKGKTFTALAREMAVDRQLTVDEIATLVDRLTELGAEMDDVYRALRE